MRSAACLLVVLTGCSSATLLEPHRHEYGGVRYAVRESAQDGDYALPEAKVQSVDANAMLVVSFAPPPTTAGERAEDPRWRDAQELLAQSVAFAERRAELMQRATRVDSRDAEAFRRLLADDGKFATEVAGFVFGLQQRLGPDKLNRILGIGVEGVDQSQPYANLQRWLRSEIEALQAAAAQFADALETVTVTVEAYLSPVGAERRALHVRNWDTIPEGKLQPIDRTGLRMTERERERLAYELEQAERASRAIRRLQQADGDIKRALRDMARDLEGRLEALLRQLDRQPTSWADALAALAENPSTADEPELRDALRAFAADFRRLATIVQRLDALRGMLRDGAASVGQLRQVLGLLGEIVGDDGIRTLLANVRTQWPARLAIVARAAAGAVSDEIRTALGRLGTEVPELFALLELLRSGLSGGVTAGTEIAAGTDERRIARKLDDLVDGIVDLRRAGLAIGDQVDVWVRFYRTQDGERKLVHETTWSADATLMGLHRKIHGDLIFARADTGTVDAKRWKPNVAAVATWQYRIRAPEAFTAKAWNWLSPGAGIHLASLDQSDDSVEFGIGFNASLWDGLVSAGWGANLNADGDRDYWFVGINLLDVLQQVRSTASTVRLD